MIDSTLIVLHFLGAAEISTLSSGKIDKHEYLTGQDMLPLD